MSPYIAPGVDFITIREYTRKNHNRRLKSKEVTLEKNLMILERVVSVVSRVLNVPVEDIKGKTQKQIPTEARQIAMHLTYKLAKPITTTAIGLAFNRNYSTVITSIQIIDGFLEYSREFREKYSTIEKEI